MSGHPTAPPEDPESPSPVVHSSRSFLLRALGPGLITGASDDDPSGIATYSQAGAQFGYGLSWTLLLTFPLMAAIQIISALIGRVTGHGIAGALRLHAPAALLQSVVVLLLVANTINLAADLAAMADAATLFVPAPRALFVVMFGCMCIYLQVFLQYARYVAVLKWLTLALFAYFASALAAGLDWAALGRGLVWPAISLDSATLTMIVAIFGTTISPYLFFWQSAEEAEDILAYKERRELLAAPEQGPNAVRRIEIDTIIGMGFSNLVALAIMATTAATLHVHGVTQIATSAQAAEALRPIAGEFAFAVFAMGIIGTGMLAVPVLAGSAAYAIGEARNWPVGFSRRWQEAKAFYGTVAIATIAGVILTFSDIDPIRALYWTAVLNGLIAVPVMGVMIWLASRADVMGRFAVRGRLRALGWTATAVMALAAIGMFAA